MWLTTSLPGRYDMLVVNHPWQTGRVTSNPDRHKNPGVLARPDPATRQAARKVLDAHDWTMSEFIVACLRLVALNPEAMLNRLAKFRPDAKRGRPAR